MDGIQINLPALGNRPKAFLEQVDQQMKQLSMLRDSLTTSLTRKVAAEKIPFVASVTTEVLPPGMKIPFLESYDDSSDPEDHLAQYQSVMQLHGFTGARFLLLPLKG